MRIVINTPTGNIGRHLADKLLDAGETVTVISRSEGKVSELQARGAAVVVGSMDDPEVLQRAFAGAKAVFWVNPPPSRPDYPEPYLYTYCDNPDPAVLVRGARNAPRPPGDDTAGPPPGANPLATTDPTPSGPLTIPLPYGGPPLPYGTPN